MKWVLALGCLIASALAYAERILLVPIDNRPAACQFAQMIGAIAGAEIRLPPYEILGQFTRPGSPEKVLDWLESQDYSDAVAVIVSTDMIAYGGLIASRTDATSYSTAVKRLARLGKIRAEHPSVKFYAFSAITRILPTATISASKWRLQLGQYVVMREQARSGGRPDLAEAMKRTLAQIPRTKLAEYDRMRIRNVQVQRKLIEMAGRGIIDYLMLGQDDAAPAGPHVRETKRLRSDVEKYDIPAKVYFCEGIDQHANVLVSRALLRHAGFIPRVQVVYSDDDARTQYAAYESKPLEGSVSDQLLASGARPVEPNGKPDYVLFLNTPKPRQDRFEEFLKKLKDGLDEGLPIAIADINFVNHASADPRVFEALRQDQRASKLLSYAGWNTAGNTVGTSIPAANMVILGRRSGKDLEKKEVARSEFLLHRLVNDFAYHTYTRPQAYSLIKALNPTGSRDEVYGEDFAIVNAFVRKDLKRYLDQYYVGLFDGAPVGPASPLRIRAIDNTRIFLPWPRAYEVRLEFKLLAE